DNCPNLKVLDCSYNDLTELDLSRLNKQLKQLDIRHNNFSEQDLKLLPNISENSEIKQPVLNSQYEVVIFFLHGLGASAIDLAKRVEPLQRELPHNIKLVFPQAPTIKVE